MLSLSNDFLVPFKEFDQKIKQRTKINEIRMECYANIVLHKQITIKQP